MVEPRSLSFNTDRWLTDSRVYNLIWLGRWLERAESIARLVNASAQASIEKGYDLETFQQSLGSEATARGIVIEEPGRSLSMLLREHQVSSIYHSIYTARGNATQIGTVELIRAITVVLNVLEDGGPASDSPQEAQRLTNSILEGLNEVYKVIDDSWFHREPLSEEEVYRRFVQQ